MKKKILYSVLIISLIINLLVLFIDTIPFLYPKVERKLANDKQIAITEHKELEQAVVKRAMIMAKSDKVVTVWKDHRGLTETVFDWIRSENQSHFKTYNYPRAFLYYGLSEYFINENDMEGLNEFKKYFDNLMNDNGEPSFKLDKVDQAPFGLVAINLYEVYKDEKYKKFYETIYKFVISLKNENGLILYRENSSNQLNDVIGMIVPFLASYSEINKDSTALNTAKIQLDHYIEYGVDKKTFIPSHGISLKSNIKTGSINWGRGIGWYLLGLSAMNDVTGDYEQQLLGIYQSLNKEKTEDNLFSQYPGSSNQFDASTSTMFVYSFSSLSNISNSKKQTLNLFAPYIKKDGSLTETSGDTYGLNSYSQTFGYSELSQGMLLLSLSKK